MSFAEGFVMYATSGHTTYRYVASSLLDALSWKLAKEQDGYRVSEPVAYTEASDNVVSLRKDGAA